MISGHYVTGQPENLAGREFLICQSVCVLLTFLRIATQCENALLKSSVCADSVRTSHRSIYRRLSSCLWL